MLIHADGTDSAETALGRGHRRELETLISCGSLPNLVQLDASQNEGGRPHFRAQTVVELGDSCPANDG